MGVLVDPNRVPADPTQNKGILSQIQEGAAGIGGAMSQGFGGLFDGLFGGLINIFNGVGSGLPWMPSEAEKFAGIVRDGQQDLADRADLLEGVRGYCAAYQSVNINSEWNVGSSNRRVLPYDAPLGPSKGAHVSDERKGIVFDEEGLWTVWVYAHVRSTLFTGSNLSALYINIYRPSGKSVRYIIFDEYTGGEYATVGGSFPVVIPEPGCYVHVEAYSGKWRWWDGGARYSFMAALKNDNRTDNPGQDTVPDEAGP